MKHLLTLYTRSPLHVGCGSSVDVVDLPVMRERITGYPVIPASSLKGVLLQHARETFEDGSHARSKDTKPEMARMLFGDIVSSEENGETTTSSFSGCVRIMEAKLLAFPVRSLAGCFAWITCPSALARFQRDTGTIFAIPDVAKDKAIAGSDLAVGNEVLLEEYPLARLEGSPEAVASVLAALSDDLLWEHNLAKRLAIVHDENFQHFVTTCTEVVARIAIDPEKRVVSKGALFNQENIPCETLFYSVLETVKPRKAGAFPPDEALGDLLKQATILQIGGDETTGHGLCLTKREEIK
jgi:CRISPR-associated protein Cmr4